MPISSLTCRGRRPMPVTTAVSLALVSGLLAGCSESDVALKSFDPAREALLESSSGRVSMMVGEAETLLTGAAQWDTSSETSLLFTSWTDAEGALVGSNTVSTPTAHFVSAPVASQDDAVACWARVATPRPDGDSLLPHLGVVATAEGTSSEGDVVSGTTDLRQALLALGPLVDGVDLDAADGERVGAEFFVQDSTVLLFEFDLVEAVAGAGESGVQLPAELETVAGLDAEFPVYASFHGLGSDVAVQEPTRDVVEVKEPNRVEAVLDRCS